jgi:hypothetical protein
LEGLDSLRFQYVISDGQHRSSAVVEIDVLSISEVQVRELVKNVRRRAAEDFGVSVDDVEITFVERIFTQPLPIVLPNDGGELDLSPGILVTHRKNSSESESAPLPPARSHCSRVRPTPEAPKH